MRKKDPGHKSESIDSVVVHREDLEEIIHSFESKEMTTTISDSGFEYETIDEVIKQRGNYPSEISISGSPKNNGRDVSVYFSSDRVSVYSWGSGSARELWYELTAFLKERRSWRKRIFKPLAWYFAAWVAFFMEAFFHIDKSLRAKTPLAVHVALFFVMALWLLSFVYSRSLHTVSLTRRSEGGFWSRNKEAAILLAIGAVLGGIVTYIVTILTK